MEESATFLGMNTVLQASEPASLSLPTSSGEVQRNKWAHKPFCSPIGKKKPFSSACCLRRFCLRTSLPRAEQKRAEGQGRKRLNRVHKSSSVNTSLIPRTALSANLKVTLWVIWSRCREKKKKKPSHIIFMRASCHSNSNFISQVEVT